jgi:hypothetical protein
MRTLHHTETHILKEPTSPRIVTSKQHSKHTWMRPIVLSIHSFINIPIHLTVPRAWSRILLEGLFTRVSKKPREQYLGSLKEPLNKTIEDHESSTYVAVLQVWGRMYQYEDTCGHTWLTHTAIRAPLLIDSGIGLSLTIPSVYQQDVINRECLSTRVQDSSTLFLGSSICLDILLLVRPPVF